MHACMRAFTTFNAKLYPIQQAEGLKKRLKEVVDISEKLTNSDSRAPPSS
jgi:hypothetical protein